jgi:hypothetical protein
VLSEHGLFYKHLIFRLIQLCEEEMLHVRFEVLIEAKMSMLVFWVTTPCGLVEEHTASIV